MKKTNISIFVKIWLSVSVLFLGYIISMIMIQSTGGKVRNRLGIISASLFPAAGLGQQAASHFEDQVKLYKDAVMMGEVSLVEKATEESAKTLSILDRIVALNDVSPARKNEINELSRSMADFSADSEKIYKKMAQGDMTPALLQKVSAQSKVKDTLLSDFNGIAKKLSDDATGEISAIIDFNTRAQQFNVVLFVIVLSVSVVIVWLVTKRSIVTPVNKAISRLKKVAPEIDLTSTQVSDASHALAEGASEQAASIEETSSSLEEMSSMTRQNADHANEANNLMQQTSTVIDKANSSMGELTISMDKISKASQETSKIIKTIDEIAFQTNLLALNAAVEAARAGEAGAGFAVVADEVRNLALRAAEAAKNTSVLIEDTVKRINDGTQMVSHTNTAFTEVAQSSATIKDLVEEIAAASSEQAQGIEQINKAVTEMDKVVQQNAASAEESASASQEMNTQVDDLNEVVFDLVDVIGGKLNPEERSSGKQLTAAPAMKKGTPKRSTAAAKELASPLGRQKGKKVTPEEIIPLDDADLMHF